MRISDISEDWKFMDKALDAAKRSFNSGGIPVGAVLVHANSILGSGYNRSLQTNDPTSHGETDCLRNVGLRDSYDATTLYTTLSPCEMCAGAVTFLGIPRIVVGERQTYSGDLEALTRRGVAITLLDHPGCVELMGRFVAQNPVLWRQLTEAKG
jgi:cytosine/creatinine deaminase